MEEYSAVANSSAVFEGLTGREVYRLRLGGESWNPRSSAEDRLDFRLATGKRRKGERAFLPPWEGSSGAGKPLLRSRCDSLE